MKDRIIAVIAAYLEAESNVINVDQNPKVEFGGVMNPSSFTHAGFCQEIAAEIENKLAPIVCPKDFPYNKLFDHMSNKHGLTLTQTELGDIINIARS